MTKSVESPILQFKNYRLWGLKMHLQFRRQLLLSPLLLFFTLSGIFPLTTAGEIITEITFTGLKRTREETVSKILLPLQVGAFYTEETEEYIIQTLRKTGIFNPVIIVEAEKEDGEVRLRIHLQDRWTLIPVPIFIIDGEGAWRGGAIIIDGNLLGLYKTLGLGFFLAKEGWNLVSFFSAPKFLGQDMVLTVGGSAGLNEIEDRDPGGEILRKFYTDKLGVSLGLEVPLPLDSLSLMGTGRYEQILPRPEDGILPLPNLKTFGFTGTIKWENLYYDIPYSRGLAANTSFTWNWGLNGSSDFPTLKGRINFSFTPWNNHLIEIALHGGWGEMPTLKQFRLGGTPGTYTLPRNDIAADSYIASTMSYNVPVLTFSWGTISLKGFYEGGFFRSDLLDPTLFHGPGLGLELYINNLAIPAVGFQVGWNLMTGKMRFSGGIGASGNPNE